MMIISIKKQRLYNIFFSFALVISLCSILFTDYDVIKTSAVPLNGHIVLIDPGHGLPDGGAVAPDGTLEADLNLLYAKELGLLIQKSGARVIYTREDARTISEIENGSIRALKQSDMKKRKHIRDNTKYDLFISIHMNKFSDSKYSGAQVFFSDDSKSKELAQCVQNEIVNLCDKNNTRKIKNSNDNIFILKKNKMPSILIECGFLSNEEELALLKSASYREKFAYAVYSGILRYLHKY